MVDEDRGKRGLLAYDAAHKRVHLAGPGLQPCNGLLASLAFDLNLETWILGGLPLR